MFRAFEERDVGHATSAGEHTSATPSAMLVPATERASYPRGVTPPFRHAPGPAPLITWCGGTLLAVDPARGTLLWERKVDASIERLLLTDHLVVVATLVGMSTTLLLLDLATGVERGRVEAPFQVQAAMRHAELIFFGGRGGSMALRLDGSVAWRAALETVNSSVWSGDQFDLVGRDASGRELWRLPQRTLGGGAFAIGDAVAQPDFD